MIKNIQMQSIERRLPQIVRDLIERVILPEIHKNSSLSASCQYFSSLLAQDQIDLEALQGLVDSITPSRSIPQIQQPKLQQSFSKRKEEVPSASQNSSQCFNPSRTFGGERSRFNMFQPKKHQLNIEPRPNGNQNKPMLSSQVSKSLSNIEKIYRAFLENQQKLQQISQQHLMAGTIGTMNRPTVLTEDRQNMI